MDRWWLLSCRMRPLGVVQMRGRLGHRRVFRYISMAGPWAGAMLSLVVIGSIAPGFLAPANIAAIIVDVSAYILLAVGMTFVITGAGIDLSIGSVLGLSGVVMAVLVKDAGLNAVLAMVVGLVTGAVLGYVNGFLITKLKMPDIVVTLATGITYRGLILVWVGDRVLADFPPALRFLGGTRLLDGLLPVSVIVALLVVAVSDVLLYKRTKFGRYTIALGANRRAAIHAGIPVDRYKIYTYMFSGAMAALGAILLAGRFNAFNYMFGSGKEFHVIATVVIGGTSLFGGVGRLWGSLAGALLISMLINGMMYLGIHVLWEYIVIGLAIILAVALYTLTGGAKWGEVRGAA